jgi:hypothetical protein
LPALPDACVDLIVTSPPYADSRKETYGGIHPDKYVQWFLPVAAELKRVLKEDGSFILNIKERALNGERHTYVIELILALRGQGWLWTEEYMWHKKNCAPGKWPNRFRDSWERCLQFTKQKRFKMYQEAVMVPTGDWAKTRLRKLGDNDKVRFNSQRTAHGNRVRQQESLGGFPEGTSVMVHQAFYSGGRSCVRPLHGKRHDLYRSLRIGQELHRHRT